MLVFKLKDGSSSDPFKIDVVENNNPRKIDLFVDIINEIIEEVNRKELSPVKVDAKAKDQPVTKKGKTKTALIVTGIFIIPGITAIII